LKELMWHENKLQFGTQSAESATNLQYSAEFSFK
jgi:hypothetical protein